jgi:DNA invertase Pin-like site-specific DNA recombinase
MGRVIFTLFSALAQLEREQIAERTSIAMLKHQSEGPAHDQAGPLSVRLAAGPARRGSIN